MSDDRDHMRRQPQHRTPWSITTLIVAINVAVFVLQNLLIHQTSFSIYDHFALSVNGLKHGCFWQLITFQFLHLQLNQGGILHLIGNLFFLWVLGRPLEARLGGLKFAGLYLLSGTLGGLLQMTAGMLAPGHFGHAIVGASAGVFGLLAAFAILFPGRHLHLFFLPYSIRADFLLAGAVIVTLTYVFLPPAHVAHVAHLGGMFCGYLFARVAKLKSNTIPQFRAARNLVGVSPAHE